MRFSCSERCTFVHVGLTAEKRCNVCKWMKHRDACQGFGGVLLSAACRDGSAAEPLGRDLTIFELW